MKRMRVLVVDDDPTNVEVAKVILEAEGHAVETAHDGLAALRRCLDCVAGYDLILMDLAMPNMDGIETIAALRGHAATREVPILVVTGSSERALLGEALAAGGNALIQKPFRRAQLLEAIAGVLPAAEPT